MHDCILNELKIKLLRGFIVCVTQQLLLGLSNSGGKAEYIDVNNKQDATTFPFINLFNSALHVSGEKFAHSQEHFLSLYTAFGTMH